MKKKAFLFYILVTVKHPPRFLRGQFMSEKYIMAIDRRLLVPAIIFNKGREGQL